MSADVTHVEREDPRPESQLNGVVVRQLLSPGVPDLPQIESEHEFLRSFAQHRLTDRDHRLERSNRAAARVCGAGSAGVSLVESDPVSETHRLPARVTDRTEMNEVRLAFRALIEQVRLVLRDGRRLIRRLIAVCDTFKPGIRVPMTSTPASLASVPFVVLRATTEREQIELSALVQNLSAEGYQVARHGPQWVVYTEITERRTSGVAQSPRKGSGTTTAMRERVGNGSLRHCRHDDRLHEGGLRLRGHSVLG